MLADVEQLVVDGGWSQDDYRSRLQAMLRRVLANAELGGSG